MIKGRDFLKVLGAIAFFILAQTSYGQCPQFSNFMMTGNSGFICEGATFTITHDGTDIPAGSFVDWYLGSGNAFNPYNGEGDLIGSVPVNGNPIGPFSWTVPADFCEEYGVGNWYIVGILDPPPTGGCPEIFTTYFELIVSCAEIALSGGGDVCEGNCPDDPTELNFDLIGNDLPYIADLIITASAFPPFEIEDLIVNNGYNIIVCLEGFFPSFDPVTGILNVPVLAIGISATVTVVSATTASGCPVIIGQNTVTLNFIAAPSANAGNDQTICADESANLSGSIGGSASDAVWTTAGDGTFDDPTDLDANYTPGPTDIVNGQVVLTLTAVDENGSCIPAESTVTITIIPSWTVEVGPPQTVCNTDVVNVMAVITGPPSTGYWTSSGDGDFLDPEEEITVYTPGSVDLANGSVILFYNMDDNGPCTAPSEPLEVTFVYAPDVDIPQNIEVCSDDSVTIHILVGGNFTDITWSTLGDGVLIVINDTEVNYTPGPMDIDEQFAIISVTVVSGFAECGETTYNIPININLCDCPEFESNPPGTALCAENDMLDLNTLLEAGGAGSWSISNGPPGSNPATITGDIFITNMSDQGIYTVTYTLNNPEPDCPTSTSEDIVVMGGISPFTGPDMAFCGPQSVNIEGIITPNLPVPILWETLGDGSFTDNMALMTTYIPGPIDSVSPGLYLVLHVMDTVCGTQSDTVTLFFNTPPFADLSEDTIATCNTEANGSIVNFGSLITGGDTAGVWTNVSGVGVDFSNPDSVNFNGIAVGQYLFQYETNSAMSPCAEAVYPIIVNVEECLCPLLVVQNVPGGICNSEPELPLNAFIQSGGPGTWQVINAPAGSNPGTVVGSSLILNGCDPGAYDLRFTLDAAPIAGCPDSAEIEIIVIDQSTLSISGDTSTCGQTSVQLNALIGGSAISVQWTTSGSGLFDNASSLAPMYSPSIFDVASAQINLIATAIDTSGYCVAPSDSIILFLVTPSSATFSSLTDTLCNQSDSGSVINLISFIVQGDATGLWIDADGALVNLSDPSHVDFDGVAPGSYRIIYSTATALLPCTDSIYTFIIVVEDCACPSLVLSVDGINMCESSTVDLDEQIILADPGAWSISSGPGGIWPEINGSELTTFGAASGNYTITYTLADSVPGCPASADVPLLVEPMPFSAIEEIGCDSTNTTYDVLLLTDATSVISDFGTVTSPAVGQFNITLVPVGQDITVQLTSASELCSRSFSITAPDCNCTLFTEDISDTITFCPGDTFVLIPFVTGAQGLPFSTWITPHGVIMWPTLALYEEGDYIWIVRDSAMCEERDSFYAEFIGPQGAVVSSNPPSCPGAVDGQLIIESIEEGLPPFTAQLDNGPLLFIDQLPFIIDQVGLGQHVLLIMDMIGCSLEIIANVDNQNFGNIDLGPDLIVQKGDSVLIHPMSNNINIISVTWDPSNINTGFEPFWVKPDVSMTVSAMVTDTAGCIYEDQLLITVVEEITFYIPTIFSPNGDQINDVLEVHSNLPSSNLIALEIFDRWGNMVYRQIENPPFQWDGMTQGQWAQSGVYAYKLLWKNEKGNMKIKNGDITVLR